MIPIAEVPPPAAPTPIGPPTVAPAPAAPMACTSAANVAAQVVDRFLSARHVTPPAAPKSCPASCPCAQPKTSPQSCAAAPAPPPQPPAPEVVIADFVCEEDVRVALRQSRKIYIGPKTIVTPAARDLGQQHDILVMAKR